MKYYLDIQLLSLADIDHHFLWEKVYKQIHLGLVDIKDSNGLSNIGVAFPEYNLEQLALGTKLRLLAPDKKMLEDFNIKKCLNTLSDYIHIENIREIPSHIKNYVRYKRQQSKSNVQRLARRKAKRESISLVQALTSLSNCKEVLIKAPFIKVSSISTGQHFQIFVIKESAAELISEKFSCYGLSAISTIPDF